MHPVETALIIHIPRVDTEAHSLWVCTRMQGVICLDTSLDHSCLMCSLLVVYAAKARSRRDNHSNVIAVHAKSIQQSWIVVILLCR